MESTSVNINFCTLLLIVWHSNTDTDKIGKLKYMVKLESNNGQTQIHGQNCCRYMLKVKYIMIKFYMSKLKCMVKRKLWSNI